MIRRYFAVFISIIGIISAVALVKTMAQSAPPAQTMTEPSKNPFNEAISASGIIEAARENVAISAHSGGLIEAIHKDICQEVKKGEPLFCLDGRELNAELRVKKAKVDVAKAKLQRLEDQLARLKSVEDVRAVSRNDLITKENDVLVAKSELEEAYFEMQLVETKLDLLTIRAPQDGTIIQKRIKEGEYLPINPKDAAFIIGDLKEMQIRADIDEQNASWITPGTLATAFPKNRPDKAIPLKFVRIDPYVIPKKSLTGSGDERVDTRVLQVIYTFEPPQDFKLYVGQQVDVFIDLEG